MRRDRAGLGLAAPDPVDGNGDPADSEGELRDREAVTVPGEPVTLLEALERLRHRGFTATFEAAVGPALRARESGRTYPPGELVIRETYRFEGVSDPDDLTVLYAIEAADGTRGTLVDAYGPYADPRLAAVLRDVAVEAPPTGTPGPPPAEPTSAAP